ncbi:MAG: TIGR04219 family outer membrane beta-barrel protein [Thiohalophilus sp.]|jgi:outer membrane protein
MKLRTLSITLACLALSSTAVADTAGVWIGGGSWDHSPSGNIRWIDTTNVDLESDMGLQDDKENYLFVQIEHPIPLLPNVRVQKTALQSTGNNPSANFDFGGTTFTGSVDSKIVLDQTDFIFYWQLLDNFVSLDLGINAKSVDGEATVVSGGTTESTTFDGIIPMGYAAVAFSPTDSLEFRGEISTLSVGDNSVTDTTLKVMYTTDYMLGIEAGIRSLDIELDDLDGVYADMKFDGPFVGVYLHF